MTPDSLILNHREGSDAPAISLCMTCMNRCFQVRETLPAAMAENPEHDVQLVLLNYNSSDELDEWIRTTFVRELLCGKLTYAQLNWPNRFHMTHAKNVAHRIATGETLINLDADNFATHEYMNMLRHAVSSGHDLIRVDPGDTRAQGGGCGRIGISRTLFQRIRGYDEAMTGWGYDDQDLCRRAVAAGARVFSFPSDLLKFIRHDDRMRVLSFGMRDRRRSERRNRSISNANLKAQRYSANQGFAWGSTAPK